MAAANRAGLALIQSEPERRQQLQHNIDYFKQLAAEKNLPLMPSDTAIQPILLGSNERAVAISQGLRNKGLLVVAIRPPTVPENSARLRVTLTANHQRQHIEQLIETIAELQVEH